MAAGCSQCGQGRGAVAPPSLISDRPLVNGVYQLSSYPDCAAPYQGQNSETWVYVVGLGTPDERMFKRSDKAVMVDYYNSFNGTVDLFHDFAERFCSDAIVDLLGS